MNRSIIAIGIIILAIGSFILYLGLRTYLFPAVRGHIQAGAGFTGFGSLVAIIGIILILVGITSKGKSVSS